MEHKAEIFFNAELDPGKEHFQRAFLPSAGKLAEDEKFDVHSAWRMVDPDGVLGMEIFLAEIPGQQALVQIPVTYRPKPLGPELDGALLGKMQHSELGERWVYDARQDPVFQRELTRTIEEQLPAAWNKDMENGEITPPDVELHSAPSGSAPDGSGVDGAGVSDLKITLELSESSTPAPGELLATWPRGDEQVTTVVAQKR